MVETSSISPGSNASPPANSIPLLSKGASKEQLFRAIRHLTTYLQHKPTPKEAEHYLGRNLYDAAKAHCKDISTAIRYALPRLMHDHGKLYVRGLTEEWESLKRKLGRDPTPYEIDEQVDVSPAYAFQVTGFFKKRNGEGKGAPKPLSSRPTLAELSSFKLREQPFFTPTAGYKGLSRFDPEAERTARVMAAPLPASVFKGVSNVLISRDLDDEVSVDEDVPALPGHRQFAVLVPPPVEVLQALPAPTQTMVEPPILRIYPIPVYAKGFDSRHSARLEHALIGMSDRLCLINAIGLHARRKALDWLKNVGIVPVGPVEVSLAIGRFDTEMQERDPEKQITWAKVKKYVRTLGQNLILQSLHLQQYLWIDPVYAEKSFVWVAGKTGAGDEARAFGLNIFRLVDDKPVTLEGTPVTIDDHLIALHFPFNPLTHRHYIERVEGTGALDMGIEWLAGIGVTVDHAAERTLLAKLWKTSLGKKDPQPTWRAFNTYLSQGGALRLIRLWETATGRTASGQMVLVAKKKPGSPEPTAGRLQLLTEEEANAITWDKLLVRVELQVKGDTVKAVDAVGERGRELAQSINMSKPQKEGGVTLAPSGKQMDEAAQRFTPQAETFGSTENVSKSEPLFTPADLIKVEPLIRPADAPKIETATPGFHGLDPDEIAAMAVPPTVTRPYRPPPPSDTADTTLLVVAAALLVVVDGPLLIGDMGAALILGGRVVFQ